MPSPEWRKNNHEKLKKYRRDWYRRNSKKAREAVAARKRQLRRWLREYKSKLTCSRCPENHPACLDFHHKDPDKKVLNVSIAIMNGWSVQRIKEEIAKCIVLCSNCHRKEHN